MACVEEEFWTHVRKTDRCWEWTASRVQGYGQFHRRGQTNRVRAHRHAFELTHGHIPKGMDVCHACDNPGCVNPAHLFVGTRKDNMQDAKNKGRTTFGEKNAQAKLTEEKVREIRLLYSRGVSQYEIADTFGVGQDAVSKIVNRKRWAFLS